jgi:hypothetical protein
MAQTAGVTIFGQNWECALSLSPQRVLEGNQVTMRVTLSPPDGNTLTDADYGKFRYTFSVDDTRITLPAPGTAHIVSFNVPPRLPDGDYIINVAVKEEQPLGQLPPFPAKLGSG